jgi:dTDP-4-dehydrorhamnose 3,5-epimerase-like enzyme
MGINDCKLIELPKISDARGNLSFAEENKHIPFDIKRIFYIYDVPLDVSRGGHAHKTLHQFLICFSGSFDVSLNDGVEEKNIHLNKPWHGLYIPPMVWAIEKNFEAGTVCLVLASDFYDEEDYFRNYTDFLIAVRYIQ